MSKHKENREKIDNVRNSCLKANFLKDNLLENLLSITDSGSPVDNFLKIYSLLNIQSDENNKEYISLVSNSYNDDESDPIGYFTATTLYTELIHKIQTLSFENADKQKVAQFIYDLLEKNNSLKLSVDHFNIFPQKVDFFAEHKMDNEQLTVYVQNNLKKSEKDYDEKAYYYFLSILSELDKTDIFNIIQISIEKDILPSNFLELNYTYNGSFIHDLCRLGKFDVVYEVIDKYKFPVQFNCHFLSEINNLNWASKIIKDFNIDIYNSLSTKSIGHENKEMITPYENLVKSKNPYRNEILKFAADNSLQDEEHLKLMSAQEFITFIKSYVTKKEILDYIDKNKIDWQSLSKVCFKKKNGDEDSLLNIIDNQSLWWMYPILKHNNVTDLIDNRGFTLFNSLLTHSEGKKLNYAKKFHDNLSLSLSKDIIRDSIPQLDSLLLNLLSKNDNFSSMDNPIPTGKNKNYFTRTDDSLYVDYFIPFYVGYSKSYGQHYFKENKGLDIIFKFMAEEIPYIQEDISNLNNDIKNLCMNDSNAYRARIKQFFYYYHCINHYTENIPQFTVENINVESLIKTNLHEVKDSKYNSVEIFNSKIHAILENIIIAEQYFPDSIESQKEKTTQILQSFITHFFKTLNNNEIVNVRELKNEEIELIRECINFSDRYNTQVKVLDSEELRKEVDKFINNPNTLNQSSNSEFALLKTEFESKYLFYQIPETETVIRKVPKF